MKRLSTLRFFLLLLLSVIAWVANAKTIHEWNYGKSDGPTTIYVDDQMSFSHPFPSYITSCRWFLRQGTGNSADEEQETGGAKIVSSNSSSCVIQGLWNNSSSTSYSNWKLELYCVHEGYSEDYVAIWQIVVKSYGSLRVEASPAGGTVDAGTKVTLTATSNGNTVSGCDIYYTLDGSTPTKSSTKYTSSGVTIAQSCWLNAKAFKTGYESFHIDEWYYYVSPVIAEVNETNFPDENFRNWILAQDYGKDGKLTQDEIKGVTRIGVSGKSYSPGNIESLKGIEYFTALTTLYCHYNQLTSLDVSKNTELKWLYCNHNKITNLNLSNNTELLNLDCNDNQLTALDVSNNVSLTSLNCHGNQLTTLDVSKNTALSFLRCYNNNLTALDVSKNTALSLLSCYNNNLTALDVSKNTALTYLGCYNNKLTSLDVSKNTLLKSLYCYNNQLQALDVSRNMVLDVLSCRTNQLIFLDVSNNTMLTSLACQENQLQSLDVTKNTTLTYLYCDNNKLMAFDVSKNTALTELLCGSNQLQSLDVSKNTALTYLDCDNNKLTSLDVSKNTVLRYMKFSNNLIKGEEMDKLINSLPTRTTADAADFRVFDKSSSQEGNVCTKAQVAATKAKGWRPLYYSGTGWLEYEGSDVTSLVKGDVNMDNAVNGTDIVTLSNIVLGRKEKTESADVNGDGSVNGTDIVALSNIILGRSSNAPRRAGEAETGLSIEPFSIQAGEEKEMLIDLSNPNDEITLVQFDLHLPEGLSIKKNGTDLDIDMGNRTSWRKHTLDANETDGGYRFLLYSSSNTVIEGTSGAVIKVKVVADASFKGGKIVIDNALLVSPDEKETKPEAYEYAFPTVDDGSAKLAIEPFNIKAGEEKEMLIDLSNPNDEITLVQFDLHLPEGLTVKKSGADLMYDMADRTSWRKHTLDANETDGGYRFLLYSSSNTVIDGTSGAIIKVTLVASQDMSGKKIALDNILLVSPDEKETKPARYEYTIGTGTGIRNITMDSQANTPIYNLRGQRLTAPQKGINIIGGKKVVVK